MRFNSKIEKGDYVSKINALCMALNKIREIESQYFLLISFYFLNISLSLFISIPSFEEYGDLPTILTKCLSYFILNTKKQSNSTKLE